jgi:hypothetical protein
MGARILTIRQTIGHLPAWRCISFTKGTFYLCGKCFALHGDGPATNGEEIWKPGSDGEGGFHYDVVPKNVWCHKCGGRAWPQD